MLRYPPEVKDRRGGHHSHPLTIVIPGKNSRLTGVSAVEM